MNVLAVLLFYEILFSNLYHIIINYSIRILFSSSYKALTVDLGINDEKKINNCAKPYTSDRIARRMLRRCKIK